MNLILIGPQGSGKGTQAKAISKHFNIPHISTGDLFRNLTGSLKQEVDKYYNSGNLVPDELTTRILKQRLEQSDAQNGFILDGFPRNLNQANLLKQITDIDKVVVIELMDELAIKRISSRIYCKKCGAIFNKITNPPKQTDVCDNCQSPLIQRDDDTAEAVKKRLSIYHKETEPIINAYQDKLIKIDGDHPIEMITKEIIKKLEK